MKILSAELIKKWDQYTIGKQGISSLDLMEKASNKIVNWICENPVAEKFSFAIFCGKGNNGGDGLAIARLLKARNCNVNTFLVQADSYSLDCKQNQLRLKNDFNIIESKEDFPLLDDNTIVIDALFGIGINDQLSGINKELVDFINTQNKVVISIDVPSGLYIDTSTPKENSVIEADYTLTFEVPKLAFLVPENAYYVGQFEILNIDLDTTFDTESNYFYTEYSSILPLFKQRKKFAHKGNFGHALLIAGSLGKMGAAQLCSHSALRVGTGLVTVHAPKQGLSILQTNIPEAMVSVDKSEEHLTEIPELDNYTAIGVGPGLGQYTDSELALENLILETTVPLIVDADAINLLANNKYVIQRVPKNSIYTPHLKEFERLVGNCLNSFERLEKAQEFCMYYKVFMVLKGAYSAIITPKGEIHFNSTGNSGMATAGSGDVLTGIITGLVAQGYSSFEASLLGVYIHGFAGDQAANELGEECLLASDIIKHLSSFFKRI